MGKFLKDTKAGQIRKGALFGKWKVLGVGTKRYTSQNCTVMRCLCTGCNSEHDVLPMNLLDGLTHQCIECRRKEQADNSRVHVGDRFGKRVILKIKERGCQGALAKYRCDCGNEKWALAQTCRNARGCRKCQNVGRPEKVFDSFRGEDLTVRQIREVLGVSRQRVYQIRDEGKLRARLAAVLR